MTKSYETNDANRHRAALFWLVGVPDAKRRGMTREIQRCKSCDAMQLCIYRKLRWGRQKRSPAWPNETGDFSL